MGLELFDAFFDALTDSITLIPFLFLTYLAMEALEHGAQGWSERVIQKAGKAGPALGALVGAVPQCGFSAMASTMFSARVITLGTLFSVYLSTSDEMLPIFLAQPNDISLVSIVSIILFKIAVGFLIGFLIDFVLRCLHKPAPHEHIHDLCEREHCGCQCEDGPHCGHAHHHHSIWLSALKHTAQAILFIFLVSFALDCVVSFVGEEAFKAFINQSSLLSVFVSALVGLIPNCAASVVISELYLEGALSAAAMMAGLLVGAGVGLLVLFRSNRPMKQNFQIVATLYVIGVIVGLIVQATGLVF